MWTVQEVAAARAIYLHLNVYHPDMWDCAHPVEREHYLQAARKALHAAEQITE